VYDDFLIVLFFFLTIIIESCVGISDRRAISWFSSDIFLLLYPPLIHFLSYLCLLFSNYLLPLCALSCSSDSYLVFYVSSPLFSAPYLFFFYQLRRFLLFLSYFKPIFFFFQLDSHLFTYVSLPSFLLSTVLTVFFLLCVLCSSLFFYSSFSLPVIVGL